MEQAGVRIDPEFLARCRRASPSRSTISPSVSTPTRAIASISTPLSNSRDVLFNKMLLPKPMKYGKGKIVSTAVDVLEELAEHHPVPALVLEYRQLAKL